MKRKLKLVGTDIELEIGKLVAVNTDKKIIYIEQMVDGTYRFAYSTAIIEDFKDVQCIAIIRED